MDNHFNIDEAKKFLKARESEEREKRESERQATLSLVIDTLKTIFSNTCVEAYLVGSLLQPYQFYAHSDIDIVLKNFKADRFHIWTQLEEIIKRKVEVIVFENCHFQEHVLKNGYKAV